LVEYEAGAYYGTCTNRVDTATDSTWRDKRDATAILLDQLGQIVENAFQNLSTVLVQNEWSGEKGSTVFLA
jgi:hypothetical protein